MPKKQLITDYLHEDNNTLGNLFSQLALLRKWNHWLEECLEQNSGIAQHCFIVNRVGTSLIVIADNPHWITRFRFHIPELLTKLRNYPELENIQAICCKVQPNYVPASSNLRTPQQKLSPENAALIREAAAKITEEKLRSVLEKLAEHS